MSYRPEQQSIPARIFTTAGWVSGHVRAPKRHRWLEHVNSCGHWLKMTSVRLPNQTEIIDFFALARTAAVLIEPTGPVQQGVLADIPRDSVAQQVHCLLDAGVLTGVLDLRPNIRVSDYLSQRADFMCLRECRLRLFGRRGEATIAMQMPYCFVNALQVVGISEMNGTRDPS